MQMLRDDNRHLKEENAALREEIARMRLMLFGSSSEKMEKGDWIVTVEEEPQPEEPQEEPKAATETGKKAEGETERKPRLKVHVTQRVWHELLPEEVKTALEKYQRLPKSCDVVTHRIEKDPAPCAKRSMCGRASCGVAQRERKPPPHSRESARDNPARLGDGSERAGYGHPRQVWAASAALPADQRV